MQDMGSTPMEPFIADMTQERVEKSYRYIHSEPW